MNAYSMTPEICFWKIRLENVPLSVFTIDLD